MSGKKKNRNKVKRTGTGNQGGTSSVVDKADVALFTEEAEFSNGHSEPGSVEAAGTVPENDGVSVGVSASDDQQEKSVELNGESSGTDPGAIPEVFPDLAYPHRRSNNGCFHC